MQTVQNQAMANVLIAWELGGGLHHLMRARALAGAFTARGHKVYVALRDLALHQLTSWPEGTRVLQAPHAATVRLVDRPSTYADILYMNGWHDAGALSGLVAGWSALFELIEPAVVVVDHAPTAALVARLGEVPLVRMGMGFFAPPALRPLPSFRLADGATPERQQAVEDAVLAAIHAVSIACGVRYASVADALEPGLDLLTCWPELDHYAGLRPAGSGRFVGPEHIRTPATPVKWPAGGATRVLAYLNDGCPAFESLLQALGQADANTVAYVGGGRARSVSSMAGGKLVQRQSLFDPGPTLAHCDVLVCHAANGLAGTALAAGKPVLMWPMTAEQQLFAHRVEQAGVGLTLPHAPTAACINGQLRTALDPKGMAARTRTLAASHAHEPDGLAQSMQAIADWLPDIGGR